MAVPAQINRYLNNHYEGMEPEQLILMLFKGALERIRLTREGIEEKNIKKRGENLSKAIAIISELNSSIDTSMNDESTQFLRGLYAAILAELPKVSINNDTEILRRAHSYISRLKEIWEKDVIGKDSQKEKTGSQKMTKKVAASGKYNGGSGKTTFTSISV